MSKLTIDPELQAKLNGLNQRLELCDPTGRTLGRFIPEDLYQELITEHDPIEEIFPFDEKEADRRRSEKGGRSLADIWTSLGAK